MSNDMPGNINTALHIFRDEANAWRKPQAVFWGADANAGWEGAGPQNTDGDAGAFLSEQTLYQALVEVSRKAVGRAHFAAMDRAITAIHGARKSDGRPHTFRPEAE